MKKANFICPFFRIPILSCALGSVINAAEMLSKNGTLVFTSSENPGESERLLNAAHEFAQLEDAFVVVQNTERFPYFDRKNKNG